MKTPLPGFLEKMPMVNMLAYFCILVGALAIGYLFVRWAFGIEKRIKQNQTIIGLLKLIAKKQGANEDEIHNATR